MKAMSMTIATAKVTIMITAMSIAMEIRSTITRNVKAMTTNMTRIRNSNINNRTTIMGIITINTNAVATMTISMPNKNSPLCRRTNSHPSKITIIKMTRAKTKRTRTR